MEMNEQKHPSFGSVTLARAQGTGRYVFGSDVKHCHTMILRVNTAALCRSFHRERIRPLNAIVEIEMSEAQFAKMITSVGIGEGTPATIRYVNHERVEDPPHEDFVSKANVDFKKSLEEMSSRVETAKKTVDEILSKKGTILKGDRKKLESAMRMMIQHYEKNIPFAHECFQEAVEHTVGDAQSAISASIETAKRQVGEKALGIDGNPLGLPENT